MSEREPRHGSNKSLHPEPAADYMNRRHFLGNPGRLLTSLGRPKGPQPSLRSQEKGLQGENYGSSSPPSLGVVAYHRLAYGPRSEDLAAFEALGSDDPSRLLEWVNQQVEPDGLFDTEYENHLAAANFTTLNKSRTLLWNHHVLNSSTYGRYDPFYETERVTILKARYSKKQLQEQLAAFWLDHFNVYGPDYWVSPMFVHYDRDVIRANIFGRFEDMLVGVAQSNAMLYYLDNYTSSNAGPNENFARELFELHTLGSMNYLGVMPQSSVPVDGEGNPVGYVDADVFEATRAFTGWTISNSSSDPDVGNTGEFYLREEWHDRFQKFVLGQFLPQDQGAEADGMQVLTTLARHPGTAQYVATKLCRRFIADDPPSAVVDAAAATFLDNQDSPTQLKEVYKTILLSDEFKNAWGEKVRRPFELVMAGMRAAEGEFVWGWDSEGEGDSDTSSFFWRFDQTGQALYAWPAPDGYPDVAPAWQSASPRVSCWRLVNWMIDVRDDADVYRLDIRGETPSSLRSANEMVDYWVNRILGRPMAPEDRTELVDFMAQGFNPDFDLPVDSDYDTHRRLQSLVGLLLMTPDFIEK